MREILKQKSFCISGHNILNSAKQTSSIVKRKLSSREMSINNKKFAIKMHFDSDVNMAF